MNLPKRESLLSCFTKVPHKGLEQVFPLLHTNGVMLDASAWDLHVDGDFPYAYYNTPGHFRLAVGASRKPLVGWQNWCALTDGPFGERRPPTIRLMIGEDGKYSLEIDPGLHAWTNDMLNLSRRYFQPMVYAIPFDAVQMQTLLMSFCELVHG